PRLASDESRRLASSSKCAPRRGHHCNPLCTLPANDGHRWFLCRGLLLGFRSFAGCFEPSHQGRNSPHILLSPGLLFLLQGAASTSRVRCPPVVRPERNWLWSGFRVAIHHSLVWHERPHVAFCRKSWT